MTCILSVQIHCEEGFISLSFFQISLVRCRNVDNNCTRAPFDIYCIDYTLYLKMFKFNFDVCDENIGSKEKVDNDPESTNKKSTKCKNKTIIKICVNPRPL